ncbi:hypothetical protein KTQ42_11370|uniref:hypothetical protein n=1 Tax=Noviherbaspirillum sp. L7-7A TaxID=2850560 RepID=UPI001C2C1457|nr:hypothetical protein [Noviherbaspirillum sp. L7-7A]MBV0879902.1 hypothetical protein [Noviherbaspirillum sp. L7-7A]
MSDTSENNETNLLSSIPDGELDDIAGGYDPFFADFYAQILVSSGIIVPDKDKTVEDVTRDLTAALKNCSIDGKKLVELVLLNNPPP